MTRSMVPRECYCHRPGSEPCDCDVARAEAAELRALFMMQNAAELRAIKVWQAAHPGSERVWPDRADLVVWLMEQVGEVREATALDGVLAQLRYVEADLAAAHQRLNMVIGDSGQTHPGEPDTTLEMEFG